MREYSKHQCDTGLYLALSRRQPRENVKGHYMVCQDLVEKYRVDGLTMYDSSTNLRRDIITTSLRVVSTRPGGENPYKDKRTCC